jgi:hypothetical protein
MRTSHWGEYAVLVPRYSFDNQASHPARNHEVSMLVYCYTKIQEDGCFIPGDTADARDLCFT